MSLPGPDGREQITPLPETVPFPLLDRLNDLALHLGDTYRTLRQRIVADAAEYRASDERSRTPNRRGLASFLPIFRVFATDGRRLAERTAHVARSVPRAARVGSDALLLASAQSLVNTAYDKQSKQQPKANGAVEVLLITRQRRLQKEANRNTSQSPLAAESHRWLAPRLGHARHLLSETTIAPDGNTHVDVAGVAKNILVDKGVDVILATAFPEVKFAKVTVQFAKRTIVRAFDHHRDAMEDLVAYFASQRDPQRITQHLIPIAQAQLMAEAARVQRK